jgi:hypothetical protein
VSAKSTIGTLKDIEVNLDKHLAIAGQTSKRLALMGFMVALLAGCGNAYTTSGSTFGGAGFNGSSGSSGSSDSSGTGGGSSLGTGDSSGTSGDNSAVTSPGGDTTTVGGGDTTGTGGDTTGGSTAGGVDVQCASTGLAAVDLSGQCRATPMATPGALEATGTA